MMQTIPHLVRSCRFPFVKRVLSVDTAPLSGDKVMRPGVGTLEELRHCCNQLLADGVVDEVIDIDYSSTYQKKVYQKHFKQKINQTHNYKGYPILGTIFSIEEVPGDYVLHFDSDMLLYQAPGYSWIENAIDLLKKYSEIIAIRPLGGPPTEDGNLCLGRYERDPRGFYRFDYFSSRVYLIDRKRFDQLLPLPVLWRSYQQKLLNLLPTDTKTALNAWTGKGALDSWEIMVTRRIEKTPYFRANLDSPLAWTLHPKARGPRFIQLLPTLIEKVEAGWYPQKQAGKYDLQLDVWLQELELSQKI